MVVLSFFTVTEEEEKVDNTKGINSFIKNNFLQIL